ncbi:MAG TPA: DNA repair protein RadA [Rectinemataceae bacterium]|nr:DNA repair protein RadA [Rectinemataceae bacterium]
MARSTAKKATIYRCVSCGHSEAKWLGRCPECGEWNSLREAAADPASDRAGETFSVPLTAVEAGRTARFATGLGELDRVLGGGLMRGSAVLLGGEPGIGKSTLLLQICATSEVGGTILYISGEESPVQLRLRAERLGAMNPKIEVLATGDLAAIRRVLDAAKPSLVVVDSLQTLHSEEAGAIPGTANQIKYCAQELVGWAKEHEASLVLVAHVTKDGMIAGPKAAEHLVDAVLGFEQGEGDLRVLRAAKNRFGSIDEIGLFRMGAKGLVELVDPTGLFLVQRESGLPPGVAVAPVHEGSRVLLVEIQALTVAAKAGLTRVYSDRIETARVSRVAAVLEKHAGLRFSDQDIYVNVAGGMRLSEPGIDFALMAALWSARTGSALRSGLALAGELSLAGELRPVTRMSQRAKAALGLGFDRVLGPRVLAPAPGKGTGQGAKGGGSSRDGPVDSGADGWVQVSGIAEALKEFLAKT